MAVEDETRHEGDTPQSIREELIFRAKLAEHAERYDEMVKIMKELCSLYPDLNTLERNLLSVAYKNAAGSRRAAWRIVSTIEEKEMTKEREKNAMMAANYRKKIELELKGICADVLALLDDKLLQSATDAKTLVFLHKMKGDYNRYIAEFLTDEEREIPVKEAENSYCTACEIAKKDLEATDPIRLGLALNYSVFCCEIKNDSTLACKLAEDVFHEALPLLDSIPEDEYKDATLILQLLRDNLTLWKADNECEHPEGGEAKISDVQPSAQPGGPAGSATGGASPAAGAGDAGHPVKPAAVEN